MGLNYEQDIRIDPDALDVEWLNQSGLMLKYTRHAADRKKEVDEAKERMDVEKARIELDIRNDPYSYGLNKVTEASVQSAILMTKDYKRATQDYTDAKYEYEIAIAAVRAMDQRKTALENLVKLLTASYFAGPKSPRDLSQENLKRLGNQNANNKVKIARKKKGERGGEWYDSE